MASEIGRCYDWHEEAFGVVKNRRCAKCVLPESAPATQFDDEGVCSQCRTHIHKRISYKGESKLLEVLDSHRGTGNKYDCLIGISGGRDSSYPT